ncbi:hypothetical protein JCGZ_19994 [Jatropha curcas]|uniref:Aminotransferase-like plant mobile domain-containing protein n=1 Tax=Jatropha curcas TaxID=180498 RepID=A0A067K7H5_JATCU|nr:hypothetical protein JCGZ_19994 [Jatropha curcas]
MKMDGERKEMKRKMKGDEEEDEDEEDVEDEDEENEEGKLKWKSRRPLQLLPLLGSDFLVRHDTDAMHGFQSEVDLGKARAGGSSTDASAFWDLLDPLMRSRVVAARFGDYAVGLRWTQPLFPPAMRYAPLDSRYTAQGYVSYEVVYKFWAERIRTRLATWRELPADARPAAPAYTREERDQAARSFIFYIISSQLLCTSQNKADPAVLACLRDLSLISSYDWASLALAHLYHGLDVWTRGSGESNWQFLHPLEVWAYEYRIYPDGPEGGTSTEARWIPRALTDLFLSLWEGDAWAAYPPRALVEALTRSRVLLHSYWVDRYFLGERVLEIHVATAQRRVPTAPPCHMCVLEGMTPEDRLLEYDGFPTDAYLIPGDYASYLTTRLQAKLPEVREYTQERRRHRTPVFYRAQAEADAPTRPMGAVLGDVPFPPGMEVALDPTLDGPAIAIPADLRCLLRDIRSYTSGSASPGPILPGYIRSSTRGIYRLAGYEGISPVRPVLFLVSRWRSTGSGLDWRWGGFLWTSPRRRMMMMMALHLTMFRHLHHPLLGRQQLVPAGGDTSRSSPFLIALFMIFCSSLEHIFSVTYIMLFTFTIVLFTISFITVSFTFLLLFTIFRTSRYSCINKTQRSFHPSLASSSPN